MKLEFFVCLVAGYGIRSSGGGDIVAYVHIVGSIFDIVCPICRCTARPSSNKVFHRKNHSGKEGLISFSKEEFLNVRRRNHPPVATIRPYLIHPDRVKQRSELVKLVRLERDSHLVLP